MSQDVARIGPRRRLAIDVPAAANLVGTLGKYLGFAALFPIPIALWYDEPFWPFLAAGAITSGLGFLVERLTSGAAARVGVREGFLVVSATWLFAAGFASLPYLFGGGDQLANPVAAYFEGMSGFTTTGATVVTDYDALPRSIDMWRAFTQWLGGMGIIVLAIAVLPRLRVGGRQMMESELPGPEIAQLAERIRRTARALWVLYVGLTALEALLLAALGWLGVDERDDRVRSAFPCVHDHAHRWLLDPGRVDRGVLGSSPMGHRRLHAARRRELRAHVPRLHPPPAACFSTGRGIPAVPRARTRRLRSAGGHDLGVRDRRGRGSDPRSASSRRSRS